MDSKFEEMRRAGKPKLQWTDGMVEDFRKLGNQIWRLAAKDRQFCEKPRLLVGCSDNDDDLTQGSPSL